MSWTAMIPPLIVFAVIAVGIVVAVTGKASCHFTAGYCECDDCDPVPSPRKKTRRR